MNRLSVIFCLILFGFFDNGAFAFEFPKEIDRCKVADTECIKNTANLVIHKMAKGLPSINLASLDPMHIAEIKLKQGAKSPVNIELNFHDVDLIGLADFSFYKVNGFQADPNGQYKMRLKGPVLYLVGPYTISGRVLILPIQGTGLSNMTLVNPDILIRFTGKTQTRNGKDYLFTDDLKLTFTIDRLRTYFANLYNGDKALGDSTNLFLNENWQEIYNELAPLIFDAFTLIIQNTIVNVFHKVPYKELFVE